MTAVADDRGAEVDGHRQHEPARVVAVAADEIHAARRPHAQLLVYHVTARSSAAAVSGTTGFT